MILTLLQQQGGGNYTFLIMLGGMFLIMYFFMIRPQQKKVKDEKTFQSNVKRGDRVVTTSGIHGKIFELNDATVVLETGAGKITFERAAISREFTQARYSEAIAESKN